MSASAAARLQAKRSVEGASDASTERGGGHVSIDGCGTAGTCAAQCFSASPVERKEVWQAVVMEGSAFRVVFGFDGAQCTPGCCALHAERCCFKGSKGGGSAGHVSARTGVCIREWHGGKRRPEQR